jgi:hypothetical protein
MTESFPIREVSTLWGERGCTKAEVCRKYVTQFSKRMVGKYVAIGAPFKKQLASAVVDVRDFSLEDYLVEAKGIHKGAALRQSRKAGREGLICREFVWKNHIPDIVEVNHSMEVRSGGEMTKAYKRGIDEMGGAPTKLRELSEPACPVHTIYNWGVFAPVEGHTQGDLVVDEKLVAYIRFKRQGSLAIYTQILGHGDYLQFGIMFALHFQIMEWLAANKDGSLAGLDYLLYGAIDSGTPGLQQWKKRARFEGAMLTIADIPSEAIIQ